MAHFAKVENGLVTDLIVVANSDLGGLEFPESEPVGRAFIAGLAQSDPRLVGEWFQTSYNTRDGLYYGHEPGTQMVDGVPVEDSLVGAFRWTFGQIGHLFDPDAGEYGEFRQVEGGQ